MNGNPFYVPPIVPNMGDTVLNLGRLSMERDRMGEEAKYREGMLSQGQQQIDIQERKLPASAQNFAPSDFMPMKATFAQKGYDKVVAPIFDRLDAWGQDKKVTKGVAANTLAQQWDTFFKPTVIDGLKKEYMTRAKNNPNFIGSPEETEIKGMIDSFTQMDGELAKRAFFPQVAEEEANSKAAIAAMREQNKPTILPAGSIALDAKGNVIKRNPRPAAEEKRETETEKRMKRKEIADAEAAILDSKDDKEVGGIEADIFNSQADKPYVYLWDSESFNNEYKQVPLPKVNGKQATAKDVYHTAEINGMTIEEVLERLRTGKK